MKPIRNPQFVISNLKIYAPFILLIVFVGVFFWQTIYTGKLPIPSDALVGMYHPWRDYFAASYERGMPFKNPLITDPVRQQIPWKKLVIDKEKQGKLPLWNAFEFSGTSLLANIQAAAFSPLNVFYFLFPFSVSWTIGIILQPLLSGLFLYLYLRHHRFRRLSALFGAVVWSYSGFAVSWLTWGTMVHVMAWVPLTLLGIDMMFEEKKNKALGMLLFAGSLVLSFFAGHSQLFFYGVLLACLYIIGKWVWRRKTGDHQKGVFVYVIGGLGLALVISSVQWIPFMTFLFTTPRIQSGSSFMTEGFFIPWQNLVQFFAPDFFGNPATGNYWGAWNYGEFVGYIGVTGLVFAISGLVSITKNRFAAFWAGVLGLSLVFATPNMLAYLPYQLHIPFLSSLQPTRLIALIDLSLAILAAVGLEAFLRGQKHMILRSLVVLGIITGMIWVVVYTIKGVDPLYLAVAKRNVIVPSFLFFVFVLLYGGARMLSSRKNIPVFFGFCFLILSVIDLFRFGWKYTPFTDASLLFPETTILSYLTGQSKPYRVIATDDRILPPNTNDWYGIESVAGYDPLYDRRYEMFIAALERGKPDIAPPYGFIRIITPKNIYSPMFPLLFVQYVFSFDEITDPAFEMIFTEGTTKLYLYKHALPRMILTDGVEHVVDAQALFDRLYSPDFNPRGTALVEEDISLTTTPVDPEKESVVITSYRDDALEALVSADTDRFLLVGNRFAAGWHGMIDEQEAKLIPADYLYFGMIVPKGEHTVTIRYE